MQVGAIVGRPAAEGDSRSRQPVRSRTRPRGGNRSGLIDPSKQIWHPSAPTVPRRACTHALGQPPHSCPGGAGRRGCCPALETIFFWKRIDHMTSLQLAAAAGWPSRHAPARPPLGAPQPSNPPVPCTRRRAMGAEISTLGPDPENPPVESSGQQQVEQERQVGLTSTPSFVWRPGTACHNEAAS